MAKTFPYAVIWNGEIIPPNTPIEVKEDKVSTKEEKSEKETVSDEKPKKRGAK